MQSQHHATINVLMATFNTPFDMTKRAIDSVLNQDFQDFEIIIIDDGSDAYASTKLLQYAAIFDHQITYVRHQNRGQSSSINRGIQLCNSPFISIIDADDEYKPNHLSTCLKAMASYDLVATHTDTVVDVYEDYYVPDKSNNDKHIHVDECILFATLFGKSEVFTQNYFETKYAADSAFFEQASQNFKVGKLPTRTYIYYRNHFDSITAKMKLSNA
jgi:glycosyltransferase involved in cell wall biosynthesis